VHEIDYYLHLVKDFADLPESERQPHAPPSDRARAETEPLIQDGLRMAGFAGSPPPLLGIGGAAAFGTAKRWLPERFADCARALRERHGLLPVLIGSQAEAEVSAEIAKQIGPPFIDLAGKGDIAALAAVLGMLRLFLTNDTGPMHLAAAQGTQVVAVFGSTNWKTTAPRGPRTRLVRIPTTCAPCLRRHCPIDHRCMTAVEVEPVLLAAEELLATE
jgi:heptosyltransferase-2